MTKNQFSSLLNQFLAEDHSSLGRVSALTAIPLRTLENWSSGRVKKPRHWQDILKVCARLSLSVEKTTLLLNAAGHHSLQALYSEQKRSHEPAAWHLFVFWELSLERPIPVQKPFRNEFFTGRTDLINKIIEKLKPGEVIAICGPGGMGKSAIASEIVWQLVEESSPPTLFPDGLFYYSFYNQPSIEVALQELAEAFGESDKEIEPIKLVKRALQGRKALIVLDGTEVAENLELLFSVTASCGVLLTSRRREDAKTLRYDLDTLEGTNALSLLQFWGKNRVDSYEAAKRVASLVDGLPLALTIIGKYLSEREENISEYVGWLESTPLKALDAGKRQHESIPILLKKSLEQVHLPVDDVLVIVGAIALNPFSRALILETSVLKPFVCQKILGELVNYGILIRPDVEYQVSHALIHTYASQTFFPSALALKRLINWFELRLANEDDRLVLSAHERAHLLRLFAACQARSRWSLVLRVSGAFEELLNKRGYWTDRNKVLAISLQAAEELNDASKLAEWWLRMGAATSDAGEEKAAAELFKAAVSKAKSADDKLLTARGLEALSLSYMRVGSYIDATIKCKEAIKLAEKLGDVSLESSLWNTLSKISRLNAEFEQALSFSERSIKLATQASDHHQLVDSLGNYGKTYISLSDFLTAASHLKKAVKIAEQQNLPRYELEFRISLGLSYFFLGRWQEDLTYQQQALKIATQLKHLRYEAFAFSNIAHVERQLGDPEKALRSYQKSIEIFRSLDDLVSELTQRGNQLLCLVELGEFEKALVEVEQHLTIAQRNEYISNISMALGNKGTILRYLNKLDASLKTHEEALMVAKSYNSRWDEAVWNKELGIGHMAVGNHEQALLHYNIAKKYFETINGYPWIIMCLVYMTVAYSDFDQDKAAELHFTNLAESANSWNLRDYAIRLTEEHGKMFAIISKPRVESICDNISGMLRMSQ